MSNLVLAVPSKGRLQENANAFFARAGLDVVRGRGLRDYRGTLAGIEGVEIAFLSASEIVSQLAAGTAHMGITGEDLVRETLPDADGERMRVATKYINLTRSFFAEQGVTDYRIVESLGATEGAPAAGQAELIVDITTTGATLAANALKVLDDGIMLRSEANLVASLTADWNERTRNIARVILGRIAAEEEARTTREVRSNMAGDRAKLVAEAQKLFGAQAPLGIAKDGPLTLVASKKKVADLADWLVSQGADHVTVAQMDYIFSSKNDLFEKLTARIG